MGGMTVTSPFTDREFGVLLHPSCLSGPEDIGTLGAEAYRFVDWLASTGATLWQILPLNPNGMFDSPYFSDSAFAGNPWLVDLSLLHQAGLLPEPRPRVSAVDTRVPFDELPATKRPQLLAAAEAFLAAPKHPWQERFKAFRQAMPWMADTAHFYAIKETYKSEPWWRWSEPLRTREQAAIEASRLANAHAIALWEVLFFFADLQWSELKAYANSKGIRVLGDLPIYVCHDSADVWLNQSQFQLEPDGKLTVQSGVPPDYFSATGQLWGNPLYRWADMAKDDFKWWVARLRRCVELTDIVRIDHFRALAAYWEVPADAADACGGRWVPGPGQAFFDVLLREFPGLPFVAEDLGTLDEAVHVLRDQNGLYGMRILQFGFDGTPDNPHRPERFTQQSIVYTGTHDNETVAAWWQGMASDQRLEVARCFQFDLDASPGRVAWSLIEAALGSRAGVAVLPLQDLLVLGADGRMNNPSTPMGNWCWRMPCNSLSTDLAGSLRQLAARYGRVR